MNIAKGQFVTVEVAPNVYKVGFLSCLDTARPLIRLCADSYPYRDGGDDEKVKMVTNKYQYIESAEKEIDRIMTSRGGII